MIALLLVLVPIGVLDSLSPVAFGLLFAALSGERPVRNATLFIAAKFSANFLSGLLVLIGLQAVFIEINERAVRFWTEPDTPDFILQIVLGVALCVLGPRVLRQRRERRAPAAVSGSFGPRRAVTVGVASTMFALPFAAIYFAAIDQILKADLPPLSSVFALFFYNAVFSLPFVGFVSLATVRGGRGAEILLDATRKVGQWTPMVLGTLMTVGGVVLIVDGIGWFLGMPILPA